MTLRRLKELCARLGHVSAPSPMLQAHPYLICGVEKRRDPRSYVWDGLKRGGDPHRPQIVLQYSLEGAGAYDQGGRTWSVPPEHCFISVVPSAHRYYLPEASPPWTFFYFMVFHEYAVRRFVDIHRRYGPVHAIPADSLALSRMASLLSSIYSETLRDDLAVEQALLDMTLEYERHARASFFPTHRQQLLDDVRQYVLSNLTRYLSVDELAAQANLSRSHYTHYFRRATGLSPARYIIDIRLEEVTRRLTQTRQTLKLIATETGFADANHLCKVFRRSFQTSPGEFRLRVAGPQAP